MPDLLAIAADEDRQARLVVLRQYDSYLQRDVYAVYVAAGDLMWLCHCAHAHKTEEAAARCARGGVTREWRNRRKAERALVNGGRTVEWRWPTKHGYASTRCTPFTSVNGTLIDYGRIE